MHKLIRDLPIASSRNNKDTGECRPAANGHIPRENARPIQSDEHIPGILILDPLGESTRVYATLTQLHNKPLQIVKVVVLSTAASGSYPFGSHIQHVTTSPKDFLNMAKTLKRHPAFQWIYQCKAGHLPTHDQIPSLLFFQHIPSQSFYVNAPPVTA